MKTTADLKEMINDIIASQKTKHKGKTEKEIAKLKKADVLEIQKLRNLIKYLETKPRIEFLK